MASRYEFLSSSSSSRALSPLLVLPRNAVSTANSLATTRFVSSAKEKKHAHISINRFPHSNLHQRDPRASSSLFDAYNGASRPASRSPRPGGYGGYSGSVSDGYTAGGAQSGLGGGGYRAATPNSKYVEGDSAAEQGRVYLHAN